MKKEPTTPKKTQSDDNSNKSLNTFDKVLDPNLNPHFFPMESEVKQIDPEAIERIKEYISAATDVFRYVSDNDLTLAQRKRKVSAGVRNYGFISKTSELASDNPQFAKLFDVDNLRNCILNIEECRNLIVMLQALLRMVSNSMMVYSDEGYSLSLIFYNNIRELSRRGNPEALEIFRLLQPFFRRSRKTSAEPSEKQLERDFHALMHGKKDGEIIIKNEMPTITKGKRVVVDETQKRKGGFKATIEDEER